MKLNQIPNMMISLKIAELYPNIGTLLVQDEISKKWSTALTTVENDSIGETLFHIPEYKWDTDKEAISEMNDIVAGVLDRVKIMSN